MGLYRALLYYLIIINVLIYSLHEDGLMFLDQEQTFLTKFCFQSKYSSTEFEFAYPESDSSIRLYLYWDSPTIWVDIFQMRLSCPKKLDLLQTMLHHQVFNLDPESNGWCRRIPMSQGIMKELGRTHMDHSSMTSWWDLFDDLVLKISGALENSRDWINLFTTSDRQPDSVTNASASDHREPFRLPRVVLTGWDVYSSYNSKFAMSNWIYCRAPGFTFKFARPVWWFFVIERMQTKASSKSATQPPVKTKGEEHEADTLISYRFTNRNGHLGALFREQFSAHQFGTLEMDIVFELGLLVLFGLSTTFLYQLRTGHRLHPLYLLLYISISIRMIAQTIRLVINLRLAITGWNSKASNVLVQLFYSSSMSAVYACLLLLSTGYTLVHQCLTRTHGAILALLLCIYTVTNTSCQIAMEILQYNGDVLSRYHCSASYVCVGIQLFAWTGFVMSSAYTTLKWSDKRVFFIRIAVVFSVWFGIFPFWVMVTLNQIEKPYTTTMIHIWDEIGHVCVYTALLVLLRPQNANTVFPFHHSQTEGMSQEAMMQREMEPASVKTKANPVVTPKLIEPKETPRSRPKGTNLTKPILRLPQIGGKPGDLPPPSSARVRNLASMHDETQNRPRSTPSSRPKSRVRDDKPRESH